MQWIRSSYSDGDGGMCVEVSRDRLRCNQVPIRDSKAPEVILSVPTGAFREFVTSVANGGLLSKDA
ncbi:DUF397 domain-containing protein [Streptomyces carpaticus]|uniref:DUF397 domain-containing protein n=1 Tax=Streptomyces carpaticus TaxID=285558 RepID=A0ABV4ZNR9_9ACTN